ncbi:MAG TPA: ABC transporter ATP-binding protein [Solirubrobacteraceae bacterium]|nr:ABC transporter ATP-binding protein [Solirubrobacteraceae bacterium]
MSTITAAPPSSSPSPPTSGVRRPAAVAIEGVSKTFRLPHQQYSTLKERALHPFRSTGYDELHAVRDLSLEIAEGEFFGIVGRNGSGKSTLLKCIAGIYGVDSGRISIAGRLSPFIELGVGFNMDLTARDNVIINAIMLGLSRRRARERFDEVIAFAELEEFVDLKLKNYSSGMLVRLAFATSIEVDAEILLIDEVLAVGDAAFQQKCFEQFYRLKREGRTIVFVSHDMYSVERFCDRAMLMEHGRMVQIGEPRAIGRAYHKLNFGQLPHEAPAEEPVGAGAGTTIADAWFENAAGERVTSSAQEEPISMCFEVRFGEDLADPVFAATLRTELGHTIVVARSDQHGGASGSYRAGETAIARFSLPPWLTPSRYTLTPSLARAGTGANALALVEDMTSIVIHGTTSGGILELPVEARIHRA